MNAFRAGFLNETHKIFSRTRNRWLLVFSGLLPVLAAVLLSRLQLGLGLAPVAPGELPLFMLQSYTVLFLPLFLFMTASDLFAGELGDRTMKLTLTRPITRFKVYASKYASLQVFVLAALAAAFVTSVAAGLAVGGGQGVGGFGRALLAYAAAYIPLAALGAAAVCFIQLFRKATGALVLCILLYAAAKASVYLLPGVSAYLPTAYSDWYMLWIGGAAAWSKIAGIFMFLTACSILFFTAGYTLFDKKEL